MTKPNWMEERERKNARMALLPKCSQCIYYGSLIGELKHKNKTRTTAYKCELHGIVNTEFSFACEDFTE